jgi:hypothetical protein
VIGFNADSIPPASFFSSQKNDRTMRITDDKSAALGTKSKEPSGAP